MSNSCSTRQYSRVLFKLSSLVLLLTFNLIFPLTIFSQTKIISGTITEAKTNAPVSGANVAVQNSSAATITNAKGWFSIPVAANGVLVITHINYVVQTIPVNGIDEFKIQLEPNSKSLDDVVIVGYGQMKKRDLTGSVGQIKTEKFEKERPLSVQDLLRSNIPGVNVGLKNTAKGGGDVVVRGQKSLAAGNSPLIVIDGVIFFGELSEINPLDVEQIDVLKDASAAAVYGAKSANGVILVTTKKGKSEKPTIRFDAALSTVSMGPNARTVYGPEGYLQYRSDLFSSNDRWTNPGKFVRPTQENLDKYGITLTQWRAYTTHTGNDDDIWLQRINLFDYERQNYAKGKTFNWYDESFRTGINRDHNISLSGKKDKFNYYWSLGYLNSEGLIVGDNYKVYRSNLKVNAEVTKFLEVGLNMNVQNRTDSGLVTDWQAQILNNSPYASPRDSAGTSLSNPMGTGLNRGFNQAFINQYKLMDRGLLTLNSILYAKVKLPFNIVYTLSFSPRYQNYHSRYWESSQNPDWRSTNNGYVERENTNRYDWQIDNIINWEKTIANDHSIKLTLLQNSEEHKSWNEKISAKDFSPSDVLSFHYVNPANLANSTITSYDDHSTGDALMARVFYSYKNRYMTTLSIRRDGYSAFGNSNPRATFPSAAFAWNFGNEPFLQSGIMNMGKLRMTWGKNGNRDIGIYTALSNLTTGAGKYPYVTSAGAVTELSQLYVDRMANPKLKWEATSSYNIGLDLGFLKNKITATIDAYYMPTTDLIMDQTLVDITGFTKITSNLGEVVNKGLEVSVNTMNMQKQNFSWSSTLNFSFNRNEIKHLYYVYEDVLDANGNVVGSQEQNVIANGWFVGHDINTIWNYKLDGIWQQDDKGEAAKYGLIPGDAKIKDGYKPEDLKYTNEDKEFLGSRNPKFRWSLRNDFTIHQNLSIGVNIYSQLGAKQETYEYMNNDGFMTDRTNYYTRNYWTPDNPSNKFARLNSTNPQNVAPPLILSKSFVRLESISISYTLPKRIVSLINAQQFRLTAAVRNAALWTKDWKYWDPEVRELAPRTDAGSAVPRTEFSGPAPRTFSISGSVTF